MKTLDADPRMGWTFPLGRITGIPLRAHVTLFLLLAWWLAPTWSRLLAGRGSFDAAFDELAVVLAATRGA